MKELSEELLSTLSMASTGTAGLSAADPLACESVSAGRDTPAGCRLVSVSRKSIYRGGDRQSSAGIPVVQRELEIRFLGAGGDVRCRSARLILPESTSFPVPVVVSLHYEMLMEDFSLYDYLSAGWAMLTPTEIPMEDLRNIVGDDLRFSIALVSAVRRMAIIDRQRIALRGASAGGYHTLLLSAMHLGLCCAFSMSGICNMAYEFGRYIPYANTFNLAMEHTLPEEQRGDYNNYRLPFVKTVADTFAPTIEALGADDPEGVRWRVYSPSAHTEKFSHPIVFSHSTADAIVPICQVTEQNACGTPGDDLPEGFLLRLRDLVQDNVLSQPLDTLLGDEETAVFRSAPPEAGQFTVLRFDPEKRYQLNIIDEGPVCSACSHFKAITSGLIAETEVLKYYMGRGAALTNRLTGEKLSCLARRYLGLSEFLEGENSRKPITEPTVFGSADSDRLDVLLEVGTYLNLGGVSGLSREKLDVFLDLYSCLPEELRFLGCVSGCGQAEILQSLLEHLARYAEKCGESALRKYSETLLAQIENETANDLKLSEEA